MPIQDGAANLSFTFNSTCGAVLIETGSVDATGSYVFEVPTQAVNKSWGHTSHHWQAGAGTDTMYTIWNPTNKAEDLIAIVNYEPGGTYKYPLHVAPNASAMLSVLDLIHMGKPDQEGQMIPTTARIDSLPIKTTDPDMRHGEQFVVSSGIYNPTAGTCCSGTWTCNGATSAQIVIANFSVAVQSTTNETFYIVDNTGSQSNYTSAGSWNSSATSVMTAGSAGLVRGISVGTASIRAYAPNVPEYAPNFCGSSCPYGSYGGSTQGTTKCAFPTGDTTQMTSWDDAQGYPSIGNWIQTLTPASSAYDGESVTESSPYAGTDSCWFSGSMYAPLVTVTGTTWVVSGGRWLYDQVGYYPATVQYYQHQRAQRTMGMPCGFTDFQNLRISCSNNQSTVFKGPVVLKGIISGTGVSSGRDGQLNGRTYQP